MQENTFLLHLFEKAVEPYFSATAWMQENTFLLHLFEKAVKPYLSATALIRGNTFPPSLFEKAVKHYLSATALIRGNTFSPSLFVWPRRFCYRSSAEEKLFGSAMLLRTPSGGGTGLPPVGRASATALPVAGGALKCSATPPIPSAQLSFNVVSSSRRRSYYRLSYLQAVAGRRSPFCRPLARSLPYRSVAARGQAPLKGGQRYFHFLYGCLPPLLTSGCSHPNNQQRHFLTSWRCFQGIFHFLSATATISASP